MENVENELECIIQTGEYIFDLETNSSSEDDLEVLKHELQLNYVAYTPAYKSKNNAESQPQTLKSEQINDFLRKVGFIDKEKKKVDSTNFLYLSQVDLFVFI